MTRVFPISGPFTALAASRPDRYRGAELSIVSILDGQIGDPVTWVDEPENGTVSRASARDALPFGTVAEDIGAHLPNGAVVVRRLDPALMLLRRALPGWHPALVVDALMLTEIALTPASRRFEPGRDEADPSVEVGRSTTAQRAAATAHLLLRFLGVLESGNFNWGLEQARYAHCFL